MKKKKILSRIFIMLEVIVIGLIVYFRFFYSQNTYQIITSTSLKKAVNVSDLSTARFIYNGIAEVHADGKVTGYIKYNAEVKAGIDMKDVDFEIDKENLIIKPVLPEIKIQASIVDEKELSFIPEDINMDLGEALKICQEDAENEAKESKELFKTAKENLENTIEALIYPILMGQGYSITF